MRSLREVWRTDPWKVVKWVAAFALVAFLAFAFWNAYLEAQKLMGGRDQIDPISRRKANVMAPPIEKPLTKPMMPHRWPSSNRLHTPNILVPFCIAPSCAIAGAP